MKLPGSKLIIPALLFSCSIFVISVTLLNRTKLKENDPVLTVNGEPVTTSEFLFIMSGLRANVFSCFSQKYNVEDSKNFWITKFSGEIPNNKLRQITIDKLKIIKIEQSLMKAYGIKHDISYTCFIEDLKTENERRKIAVSKNEPVYGPLQFEEKVYYDYLQSEGTEKLKQALSARELLITDEELETYYIENKESKFRSPDYVKIEKVTLLTSDENDSVNIQQENEVLMSKILRQIRSNEKFKNIVADLRSKKVKNIEYEELVFDPSTYRLYNNMYPEISSKINGMKINQLSDIIRENNSLNIIRIVEKKSDIFLTFEEVKGQIKSEITNEKYKRMINKLNHESSVTLNEKALIKMLN